mmetsp:Transcript_21695/g.38777  ORF Transcript_21695/g.38777 Transcript_21695/m.38777 type:complete len:130 (+) Transcript_21695:1604-1993(+)
MQMQKRNPFQGSEKNPSEQSGVLLKDPPSYRRWIQKVDDLSLPQHGSNNHGGLSSDDGLDESKGGDRSYPLKTKKCRKMKKDYEWYANVRGNGEMTNDENRKVQVDFSCLSGGDDLYHHRHHPQMMMSC